jgi:hypothetical protein
MYIDLDFQLRNTTALVDEWISKDKSHRAVKVKYKPNEWHLYTVMVGGWKKVGTFESFEQLLNRLNC